MEIFQLSDFRDLFLFIRLHKATLYAIKIIHWVILLHCVSSGYVCIYLWMSWFIQILFDSIPIEMEINLGYYNINISESVTG